MIITKGFPAGLRIPDSVPELCVKLIRLTNTQVPNKREEMEEHIPVKQKVRMKRVDEVMNMILWCRKLSSKIQMLFSIESDGCSMKSKWLT